MDLGHLGPRLQYRTPESRNIPRRSRWVELIGTSAGREASPAALIDRSAAPGPITGAELLFVNLSDRRGREGLDEMHDLGRLDRAQCGLAHGNDVIAVGPFR